MTQEPERNPGCSQMPQSTPPSLRGTCLAPYWRAQGTPIPSLMREGEEFETMLLPPHPHSTPGAWSDH